MDIKKSYIHTPQTDANFHYTIPERLEYMANLQPNKTAFVIFSPTNGRVSISCKDLYDKSTQFAKGLVKCGVQSGDIIGISLLNTLEWLICTFGTMISGAIPLYFSFKQLDGRDVISTMQSINNCKALIFNPGQGDMNWKILESFTTFRERGLVTSNEIPTLELVICDRQPLSENLPFSVEEIFNTDQEVTFTKADPDDVCLIFLTSGSTGIPKAVPRTHFSVLMMGYENSKTLELTAEDIYYNGALFMWGGGFPHTFLHTGATRLAVISLQFSSIAERAAFEYKCMKEAKCDVAVLFPYCLAEIGNINKSETKLLKTIASTGLPIPSICAEVGCRLARKFVNFYGSTELGFISQKIVYSPSEYKSFMIGKPVSGVEMKIVDQDGNIVAVNTQGEIMVRHYNIFLGYINNKVKTDSIYSANGWYKTDDMGSMNENGDVVFMGRKSDMMIIAGAILSPALMEERIKQHPDVEEVCVVPIDDEKFFQQQCACIVPKPGKTLDKDSIISFIESRMTDLLKGEYGIDVPKYFLFIDSIPKTSVGKVYRKGVLELANTKIRQMQ